MVLLDEWSVEKRLTWRPYSTHPWVMRCCAALSTYPSTYERLRYRGPAVFRRSTSFAKPARISGKHTLFRGNAKAEN